MQKKNAGFTLIELILALAISAVVMVAAVSLFPMFGRMSLLANDVTNAQHLAQMKLEAIEDQLIHANYLSIDGSVPETKAAETFYIYLSNDKITRAYANTIPKPITSDKGFGDYTYTILFTKPNPKILKIDLSIWNQSERLYQTTREIYVENLISGSISGISNGSRISYKLVGNLVSQITVGAAPIDYNSIVINEQTMQLKANIFPPSASKQDVTWTVDKETVASIDQNGLLTPLSNGIVTVKATAQDGTKVFGTKLVTIVNQGPKVESLSLSTNTGANILLVGGTPITIAANIEPTEAAENTLQWKVSSNEYVKMEIDDNNKCILTSKGIAERSVIVSATTEDGSNIMATIEILIP